MKHTESVKEVFEKDLGLLLERRAQELLNGNNNKVIELTKIIKETVELVQKLNHNDELNINKYFSDYSQSMNMWLKENLDDHVSKQVLSDEEKTIYRVAFENGIGIAEVIAFNKQRKTKKG